MLIYFDLVQKKHLALLDILIAASRESFLSDLDIRQEVDTFVIAVRISKFIIYFRYLPNQPSISIYLNDTTEN